MSVSPSAFRFIKLGTRGKWEPDCIEGPSPTIRLGFDNPHHDACLNGDWRTLEHFWLQSKRRAEATKTVTQTKDFYTLDADALWITFYNRKLYWCFAHPEVTELEPGGSRIRKVIDKWRCTSLSGEPLLVDNLSGKLTKMQGFRGTICNVHEHDYLLAKLNNASLPDVKQAEISLKALKSSISPLIQRLHWKDFELLVDLVFTRAGWQRLSPLGKTEKSIDLDMFMPVTARRAFVQVKSSSTLHELKDYVSQFRSMKQYQEMFYIVHTSDQPLHDYACAEGITFIGLDDVASLAVDSGLAQWLIQRTS
jgi:hypothetical protein